MNVRLQRFVTLDEQSVVDLDGLTPTPHPPPPYFEQKKKSQEEEKPTGHPPSPFLAQGLDGPLTMTVDKIK